MSAPESVFLDLFLETLDLDVNLMQILHQLICFFNKLIVSLVELAIQSLALGIVILFQMTDNILKIAIIVLIRLLLEFNLQLL